MNVTYDQLLAQLKNDLQFSQAASFPSWVRLVIYGVVALILLALLAASFYKVRTNQFRIVERFGKYRKTANPGLHFRIPLVDCVHPSWSLAISQTTVKVETITDDKVTVVLTVPVQYNIITGQESEAFYKLRDGTGRITSVVFDVVRSEIPKLTLDDVFGSKDTVALAVQAELRKDMQPFGYEINRVMITEVEPDAKVKSAMNEINAAQKIGESELAKAHNEQQVQVARAKGRLEAADLDRQAEVIDARAVKESIDIIETALAGKPEYLVWKWIHMMQETDNHSVIYVATEAGIPILEAGKLAGGMKS